MDAPALVAFCVVEQHIRWNITNLGAMAYDHGRDSPVAMMCLCRATWATCSSRLVAGDVAHLQPPIQPAAPRRPCLCDRAPQSLVNIVVSPASMMTNSSCRINDGGKSEEVRRSSSLTYRNQEGLER